MGLMPSASDVDVLIQGGRTRSPGEADVEKSTSALEPTQTKRAITEHSCYRMVHGEEEGLTPKPLAAARSPRFQDPFFCCLCNSPQ
jgi:hypothetical protein